MLQAVYSSNIFSPIFFHRPEYLYRILFACISFAKLPVNRINRHILHDRMNDVARSIVRKLVLEREGEDKDGSFSKKEDAQGGERRRVILPRPVISDICISLSLTVPRYSIGGSDLHANGPT